MEPTTFKPANSFSRDLPLDDEHAHILIEYDESVIPFISLKEAIEATGPKIVRIFDIEKGPQGIRTILIRLDNPDARSTILVLSKYPLIKVEGYNSGAS